MKGRVPSRTISALSKEGKEGSGVMQGRFNNGIRRRINKTRIKNTISPFPRERVKQRTASSEPEAPRDNTAVGTEEGWAATALRTRNGPSGFQDNRNSQGIQGRAHPSNRHRRARRLSLARRPGTSAATVEANQKLPGIHLVVGGTAAREISPDALGLPGGAPYL